MYLKGVLCILHAAFEYNFVVIKTTFQKVTLLKIEISINIPLICMKA